MMPQLHGDVVRALGGVALLLVLAAPLPARAADRVVLGEYFTATW